MDLPSYRAREVDVRHNTKIKHYLDGFQKHTHCSNPIFKDPRWEDVSAPLSAQKGVSKPKDKMEERADNTKRAVDRIFDIAYINRFDYMITLTIDAEKIDRYDPMAIAEKVKIWLKNAVKRRNLRYLIVPELHKDGAVHMHGLISGDFDYVDSGTVSVPDYEKPIRRETAIARGYDLNSDHVHTVYNIPQWKYGWSTAVACYGDVANAAKYMCKYVTKDLKKIFGKYYYAGGDIIRDPNIELVDSRFDDVPGYARYCEPARMSFKYGIVKDGEYHDE